MIRLKVMSVIRPFGRGNRARVGVVAVDEAGEPIASGGESPEAASIPTSDPAMLELLAEGSIVTIATAKADA